MTLSSDEVWRKVEEDRRAEEHRREPYLIAFRAQPEEIELCRFEDTAEAAEERSELHRFAERLAQCGREAVRFERYLIRHGFYPGKSPNDPRGQENYSEARSACSYLRPSTEKRTAV